MHCGIDLGTTYSSISWYDEYNTRVETVDLVTIADGQRAVRSVIYYPGQGQNPVVGEAAWNARRQFPDRVVVGIKRSMGAQDYHVSLDGKDLSPQEISAEILKALVAEAKAFLGEDVTDAIITVPAYFDDPQRAATKEAGRLAGLTVPELLPEPHAAALAYCIDRALDITDKYLLVYDLGGGTFDVTLIHAFTKQEAGDILCLNIQTLDKQGNAHRGGLDWDEALADIVCEKLKQGGTADVRQDPKAEAILLDNCEKAKRLLGQTSPAVILADAVPHQAEVSRTEFEDKTSALLLETQMLMEQVLQDAKDKHGIEKNRIEILLSGGATKMPMVREMIQSTTGKEPLVHKNPELLVTVGAAYWAHLIRGGTIPYTIKNPDGTTREGKIVVRPEGMIDTAAHAIGVEALRPAANGEMEPYNYVLIPVNSPYEKPFTKEFTKSEDGMATIPIILYKSDNNTENLAECTPVAACHIVLPTPGSKGERVIVELWYDRSGIVWGTARDVVAGQTTDIVIEREKLMR